ncbi:helix-turn-helix domain-containing protein [Blautia massiliensis (ex Durand et al. 2017)]|uniref:helix-turn-helix domain-containing protein n=1 Tax=Blautia massiliensis (ex Durand et al. 2017) TaxID=1737424 RepID=UPI00265742C8|nr:AraC family transcriptional regulator [Blautia massiliensis (ex Durand et al. 2017)]
MILGEDKVQFHDREFTVIPSNYPHTTNSDIGTISRWEYLFIDVEGFLDKFINNSVKKEKIVQRINSRSLFLNEKENRSMAGKILKILDIMRDGEEFYLEEAKGVLASLLVEIARINRDSGEERCSEGRGKVMDMISRFQEYISDHYMEDLRIDELAEYCHISETHLRRIFTTYMKMSPLEYINTIRIQAACDYLKKTDQPIADIAYKCGFTTNSTFNRNFRQVTGMTPLEWRKRPENYEQQLLKFDIHSEEGW